MAEEVDKTAGWLRVLIEEIRVHDVKELLDTAEEAEKFLNAD